MAADTARSIELLLKRFEPLRNCGLIELLTVEAAAGCKLPPELPPHLQHFSTSRRTLNVLYGQPAGSGLRVIDFRFLGSRSDVSRFCNAASAATQRMAVPLAQAGFIHPADCKANHKDAHLCTWLVAMLAAAEEGRLLSDGMQGGGWRVWGRVIDTFRVLGTPDSGAPVGLLEAGAGAAARYAVLENVVETSIALLECLAAAGKEGRECKQPKEDKKPKPFHNLVECIEHILSKNGTRERLLACGTAEKACEHIQNEYPGQPATPSGLYDAWKKVVQSNENAPAWPWRKAKRSRRTVVEASRLSEDFDFGSFEASGIPASRHLKCSGCGQDISSAERVRRGGRLFCIECGVEKLLGIIPPQ